MEPWLRLWAGGRAVSLAPASTRGIGSGQACAARLHRLFAALFSIRDAPCPVQLNVHYPHFSSCYISYRFPTCPGEATSDTKSIVLDTSRPDITLPIMAAPVTEEKQQHQATTAEPAGNSAATHATNPGTTSTDNHDNPPSFEDATGISSRDANTVTSPPLVGSPPARDLPPGIVNEEYVARGNLWGRDLLLTLSSCSQATNSPGVNNYGYVASPPGGMNHPQGMGQPVVNYEGAPQMVTPLGNLGEGPALIDCPYCHRRAMTKTDKEGTSMQM